MRSSNSLNIACDSLLALALGGAAQSWLATGPGEYDGDHAGTPEYPAHIGAYLCS